MDKLIYTEKELPQKSDEWKEKRKACIGGSDIAAVLGLNPYETGFKLWERKTGRAKPKELNAAMQRGIELESSSHASIKVNLISKGIKKPAIIPLFALHSTYNQLGVSFDGVDKRNKFITEIKCPLNIWNFKSVFEKGVHSYYYPQVQLQLFVAYDHWKIKTAYFCSYYPDGAYILQPFEFKEKLETLAVIKVEYDEAYCLAMAEAAKTFWGFIEYDYWDEEKYRASVEKFNDNRSQNAHSVQV